MRVTLIFIVLVTMTFSASAYVTPPDAYCGNPPQNRYCTQCHGTYPLNSGNGYIQLDGLPADGFLPNQTYNLTLTLAHPGQSRWSFEVTCEYQSGTSWLQGGTFTITQSSYTTLSVGAGSAPDYVKNNSSGTFNGTPGPTSWQFNWTAPDAAVSSVNFYFAGAACNGSGSGGDYIYGQSTAVNQYIAPQPPVVSDIPNQTILIFDLFDTLYLDQYVDDPDTPDSLITWECEDYELFGVIINGGIAYFEPFLIFPSLFGVDTLTFTASDPGGLSDSDIAIYTIINNPPVLGDIPDITVFSNEPIPDTDLYPYVTDPEPLSVYYWYILGDSTNITPQFNDNILSFTQVFPDWFGSQTFTVEVMDGGGLTDTDDITVNILQAGMELIPSTKLPSAFALYPSYPNPFNAETIISFALSKVSFVDLVIYNASGRRMMTLCEGYYTAGYYNIKANFQHFASGIYLVSFQAGDYSAARKIVLVK